MIDGNWAKAEVQEIARHLTEWGETIDSRLERERSVGRLIDDINRGLTLEALLNDIFASFDTVIPFDRIGCAILSEDAKTVTARWARTKYETVRLGVGYSAPMAGSSLRTVLETRKPRVISDLEAYLDNKPESKSTRTMVQEGIRSSLTCPLIADDRPVGFLFFSNREAGMYDDEHIELFQRIANPVAVLVEKARLVSDMAEQRELLAIQNAKLNELDALKNQFVGMVAHDVRNPLASIIMLADHLQENPPENPAERREVVAEIRDQARNLLDLVEELLDLTKIESGAVALDIESIELRSFLEDAVGLHARLAQPKGTTVILKEVPADSVAVDPQRLRQIIDNLISNAVKFSPPGSVIKVRATPRDRDWLIEIEDQGPGISQSDQERLFTAFAKRSAVPTGDESSSGLGLAICKLLVDAHNGQIGARSIVGGGSVFWFSIPRRDPAPQQDGGGLRGSAGARTGHRDPERSVVAVNEADDSGGWAD